MKLPKIANYRPIVLGAIMLAIGITLSALTLKSAIGFFVCLGAICAMVIVFFIIRRGALKVASVFMLVGFVLFGSYAFINQVKEVSYSSVYIEAKVNDISKVTSDGNKYIISNLTLNGEVLNGKAILVAAENYDVGDKIGAVVSIETISFDPFDSYSVSRYQKGIKYTINAVGSVKIGKEKLNLTEKLRSKLRKIYIDNLGEEDGGIALGLVIGDKAYIDYDTNAEMRSSGLSHLFSVSGLHVGFMCALIFAIFKKFNFGRRKSFIVIAITLLCYGILTGFPIGVVRASVMTVALLIAELQEERSDPLTTLAIAVIIILFISPIELFGLSFQLSVGAVFGIICFYRPLKELYGGGRKFVGRLWSLVAISISANAFIFPITAYSFGTLSTCFIFANVIAVPIISFVYSLLVPLSLAALIVEPLGILITPLGIPIALTRILATAISVAPFSTVEIKVPCASALLFAFALTIISRFYMGSKTSKAVISSLSFLACALIIILI